MAIPRFHAESLDAATIRLTGDEARHALRARRVAIGETVSLFDGAGGEAIGTVTKIGRDALDVQITSRSRAAPPPGPRLTIATAVPKGPRAEWMVEKAAELGVAALWPLRCRRSVTDPGRGKLDKWRRIARESNKQSGRNDVMSIADVQDLSSVLRRFSEFRTVSLADFTGKSANAPQSPSAVQATGAGRPTGPLVLIGPEGGFAPDEIAAIIAVGALRLRLATHTLRIETAVLAAAAQCSARA